MPPSHRGSAERQVNTTPNQTAQTLGRILICGLFMASAMAKFSSFDKDTGGPMMAHLSPKLDRFQSAIKDLTGFKLGIPKDMYPRILLTSATAEFLGALLFVADIRFGAQVLAVFLIVTSFVMHNFWDYAASPVHMQDQMIHFMKNVAIIGGLVYYLATAPGTVHKNKYQKFQDEVAARRVADEEARAAKAAAAVAGSSDSKKDT